MDTVQAKQPRRAADTCAGPGPGCAEHWRASRQWHGARGLTLLEVVLATALLGMIAACVLGALSSIWGWQARQQQMLGAAEVANRLMLTYLDDRTTLPSSALPVGYGPYRYHWELEKGAVKVRDPVDLPPEVAQKRADRTARSGLERIEHITVRVWLSEESRGGGLRADDSAVLVSIDRLADPVFFRNPDSLKKMFNHPEKMGAIMGDMMSGASGGRGSGVKDEGKGAEKAGGGR